MGGCLITALAHVKLRHAWRLAGKLRVAATVEYQDNWHVLSIAFCDESVLS